MARERFQFESTKQHFLTTGTNQFRLTEPVCDERLAAMKLCLTFVSVVAGFTSISTASDIPKKPFHLDEKAVRIGDTLDISGSVGAGEMPAAIRESYDELKRTLAAHGLDFRNVVKENFFTTYLDAFKDPERVLRYGMSGRCLGAGAATLSAEICC
jgi:hypothetical protein